MTVKKRRIFTAEFRVQIIQLYLSGKPRKDKLIEYDLIGSTFDKWIKKYENSSSFKDQDNKTPEQLELGRMRKEFQQLNVH